MSVQDVIKKSFLQGFQNTNLSMKEAALLLIAAGLIGVYLFFLYRMMMSDSFYSASFNVSLIMMCFITTAIIVTIQSSVVISLGMVGALSIVRFRTAIKDPLDLIFMFWSISLGIVCGAGMLGLAVMLALGGTVLVFVFYRFPEMRKSMLLVINAADDASVSEAVLKITAKYDKSYSLKSKTLTQGKADILLEIRVKDYEALLQEINAVEGVTSVSVMEHKGDAVY